MYNFSIRVLLLFLEVSLVRPHLLSSKKVKKFLQCLATFYYIVSVSEARQTLSITKLVTVDSYEDIKCRSQLTFNNNDRFFIFCTNFESFSLVLHIIHSKPTFIQECEAVFLLPPYTIQPFQRRNLKAEYNTEVEHYNHFCKVVSVRKTSF